jgi:hypothetical protein
MRKAISPSVLREAVLEKKLYERQRTEICKKNYSEYINEMIITDAFDHKAAKQCNVFLHKTSRVHRAADSEKILLLITVDIV